MTSAHPSRIHHCRVCGTSVNHHIPADDSRIRAVCPSCGEIHYENPVNVVGTVPVWHNRVLLCLRNIEPRKGYWTLPAGFMELGESPAQGAQRETDEEAGATIAIGGLFSLLSVERAGQVHFFYLAQLLSDQFHPGPETVEAKLFSEDQIPWDQLAFKTVDTTLRRFFSDQKQGHFGLHCVDM